MKLIGIDGGGTKTEAVLFNETGHILGRHRTGPCNPNLLGLEASAALVKTCVDELIADGERLDGIYIGTAGIFTKDDGPRFAAAVSGACGVEKVKCENDVMNVIASATDSDRCVAGVCGTGMIVYAKEPDRVTRLGGWGYLLEHGGSGYAIGRDAIRAALDDSEGTKIRGDRPFVRAKFPTGRSPVAKCVMIAEANTDAAKSFCDAPDGTGHRDMARSESSARELGRPADAKAAAGVGGSVVAGKRVMTVGIPRAEGESRSDALAGVRRVPALRAPQTGRRVPIRFGRSA